MSVAVRRAAPLAAVLACALTAPAARAADAPPPPLRAQIAQATPTPSAQPPLSGTPPVPLATPSPTATAGPSTGVTSSPSASSEPALPQTGFEAAVIALAGVSLLSLGAGLRVATADGARG
jgi:LPXTG-motif cell wall-anchored protein